MTTLVTPIYGWHYPDSATNINQSQMQTLATDMDTTFAAYDARNVAGSALKGVSVFTNSQTLTLNTDTTISFTGEDWDELNSWAIGSPTIVNLTPGVYFAAATMQNSGTAGGLGLRLKLNGTTIYDAINSDGLASNANRVRIFGDVYVTANSTLVLSGRWFGSGTGGAAGYTNLIVNKIRNTLP